MKRIFICILTLSMLFSFIGCSAENKNSSESANTPDTENTTPGANDTSTVPDGSGNPSDGEAGKSPAASLTSEDLQEWTDYFNALEHNGLLRFPYAGLDEDPDQLAPYLHLLFYDIGESESTFSADELALLEGAGLWLELDAFRLSRDFMNGYLFDHLNMPAEKTENLLDAANLGIYLMEYDAWYIAHGDTSYNPYTIEKGWAYADGTVQLSYSNDFLCIVQESGELDYIDASMVITLVPREDGSWYVLSHQIASNPYS